MLDPSPVESCELKELRRRLDRLEMRARRWGSGGLAGAGILALVVMGTILANPSPEETATARRFVVVDKSGSPQGEFSSTLTGPALSLFDQSGRERLRLEVARSSPHDQARVAIFDASGRRRAVLGSFQLPVGDPDTFEQLPPSSLVLFEENGEIWWQAPQNPLVPSPLGKEER